jgi:Flp pilus assembly protein TadD
VKKTSASDQASLAKAEKDADAAPTGAKNVALGLAYFGYGQYDKAVEQLQKGIQKGGLRNDADAHLLLGIALLKAGHKDEAAKSFKEVKGDPVLERLASLWVLHAKAA